METITFYSYKGGVGRTLMVANVAKYLARFGLKVFLMDFDLEAPGLHYKLADDLKKSGAEIKLGLVDFIYSFITNLEVPISLADYVVDVAANEGTGWIKLMAAGNVPTREYWRRLARINWHDLFYGDDPQGIPFFLELQARIEDDYNPDLLLIDSRTGITEIGGVTTTILADKVVCLLLHNPENLEGAREVLRSIKAEPRIKGQKPVEIVPIIARLPYRIIDYPFSMFEMLYDETKILEKVTDYLNEVTEDLANSLNLSDVLVVHSEPDLQVAEQLLFGGSKYYTESPLLRDYLNIFDNIISKEILDKNLPQVIESLNKSFRDDPEKRQSALEWIALSNPRQEVMEELYQIYLMRRCKNSYVLERAYEWHRRGLSENDPFLWKVIKENYFPLQEPEAQLPCPLEFVEKVLRAAANTDVQYGTILSSIYEERGDQDKADRIRKELYELKKEKN